MSGRSWRDEGRSLSYPPDSQVVTTGSQEIRVHSLCVWDPHDFCGGVGVVKRVPADELGALLLQAHQLHLKARPRSQLINRTTLRLHRLVSQIYLLSI